MIGIDRNIELFRREKGLTQEKFGDIIGVTRMTISQWETGQVKGYDRVINKIQAAFPDEDLSYLLNVDKNETVNYKIAEERIDYKMIKSNENRFHPLPPEDGCQRFMDMVKGIVWKEDPKTGEWYKAGFIPPD